MSLSLYQYLPSQFIPVPVSQFIPVPVLHSLYQYLSLTVYISTSVTPNIESCWEIKHLYALQVSGVHPLHTQISVCHISAASILNIADFLVYQPSVLQTLALILKLFDLRKFNYEEDCHFCMPAISTCHSFN